MASDGMDWNRLANFVLRAGVAFAFLYPPIAAVFNPNDWIGYFPSFMHGYVPDMVLLHGFGLVEVVIALWILWGRNIFWPSLAATAILLAIVIFDFQDFVVIFRDLSLAAAALSLALSNVPKKVIFLPAGKSV
ncbi:hypothetical protein A2851_01650 [Candidatus Kaiserbacteria bacterium RIFCSPHIGHO2_01_FULL_53_29]|uniref:DoxX family protein n=1 Tax=Candidatus Kaiserbacteria bacterium RIFCSPHIGHO2_01_FULL_53_29 TaxID=1798480 RepID=A0A1F6CVS7_9BACT|nr:MAG: hypothetical protein A2851_01650 [Candidatus Kaiserbacteria bacterium RIFCSPHIGHO2_01_FULL_53_29]